MKFRISLFLKNFIKAYSIEASFFRNLCHSVCFGNLSEREKEQLRHLSFIPDCR